MKTNLDFNEQDNQSSTYAQAHEQDESHHDSHHHHDHSEEKSCCGDCQGGGACKRYSDIAQAIENHVHSNTQQEINQ